MARRAEPCPYQDAASGFAEVGSGLAVGDPLPFTGEGDHAKRGGGGGPNHRCVWPPPSVAFGATFPRKGEKDPDCTLRTHIPCIELMPDMSIPDISIDDDAPPVGGVFCA